MKNFWNSGSPLSLAFSRAVNLLQLNVLWLICCIPIITIGPATAAMHYVIGEYINNRSDEVRKPFFYAFRRDFRQTLLPGILVILLYAVSIFDGLFILANFSLTLHPVWIPFFVLLVMDCAFLVYLFPMLARYQLGFFQLAKTALILFWQNITVSLQLLLITLFPLLLGYLWPNLIPEFIFLWLLIGGTLTAFLCDRKLLSIFEQEERKEK